MRGSRIAFVEVKRRRTRADAEAALTPRQAARISRAAQFWISRHLAYRDHQQGFDAVLVVPGRLPKHLRDALHMTFPDLANRVDTARVKPLELPLPVFRERVGCMAA